MQEICPITRMSGAATTVRGIITEKGIMADTVVRTNTAVAETEAATRNCR